MRSRRKRLAHPSSRGSLGSIAADGEVQHACHRQKQWIRARIGVLTVDSVGFLVEMYAFHHAVLDITKIGQEPLFGVELFPLFGVHNHRSDQVLLPSHQDVQQMLPRDEMVNFFFGICFYHYDLNSAGERIVLGGDIGRDR
jgi:hypothetical protein